MKKFVKFLGVLMLVFLLSGCYKYNVEMEIGSDRKVSYKAVFAINKTMFESFEDDLDETEEDEDEVDLFDDEESEVETEGSDFDVDDEIDVEKLKDAGYTLEEYNKKDDDGNEWVGYTITKDFGSIDDLLLEKEEVVNMLGEEEDQFLVPDKLFFKKGNVYKAQLLFDYTDEEESAGMSADSMDSYFDLSFQVTLPKAAISNNADEVSEDQKTLTWNCHYGKKTQADFEFEIGKSKNSLLIIVLEVAALFVIAGVVVFVAIKNSKNKETANNQQ